MNNKIIRTICYFTKNPTGETVKTINGIAETAMKLGYEIQTKRICSPDIDMLLKLEGAIKDSQYILGAGRLSREQIAQHLPVLYSSRDISFHLDLTDHIQKPDIEILKKIIQEQPRLTFNFTYVFNNVSSAPFFPSGAFEKEGFAIGFQPTNLSEGCISIEQWLNNMKSSWMEIFSAFQDNPLFLGIDSSIAPLFTGAGSFVSFIRRLGMDFSRSVTTDTYVKITNFIKHQNPKPVGLCGFMFPCLEDFELADEYEKGNFSIERNVFLSLHSGLGIDTYPIGINESHERIMEVLSLVQGLSNKHKKPLSVRFVSDGKAHIGEKTDFKNQYLKDVVVRPL